MLLQILVEFHIDKLWPLVCNNLMWISKHCEKHASNLPMIFDVFVDFSIDATGYLCNNQ